MFKPRAFLPGGATLALLVLTGCPITYHHAPLVTRRAVSGGLLFHDVRVFAATGLEAVEHQDVTVRDGRITSVAPTAAPPGGVEVVEGAGKTLLPGFVDLHGHLTGTAAAPWRLAWPDADHTGQSYLYCGVTSVYDVAGDLDALAELRGREQRGEWTGPRFTYSGQMVTAADGYPASMVRDLFSWPLSSLAVGHFATEISDAAEAERAVALRQRLGADHVKVGLAQIPLGSPVLDRALLEALVATSHARGMKVVAHIDTEEHALLAARAGVDVLVHLVQLGPLSADAAKELAERHVPVVLTLVAFDRMERIKELRYAPTEIERRMHPADMLEAFSPAAVAQHSVSKGMAEWVEALQKSHAQRLQNVTRLREAGVEIVAGSDGEGSAATWAGGAYLEELQLMAQAGLPNAEVLLAATSRPARLMQRDADFGTIEVGKRADLLLVRGNPLEDLDVGSRIELVVQGGAVVERLR